MLEISDKKRFVNVQAPRLFHKKINEYLLIQRSLFVGSYFLRGVLSRQVKKLIEYLLVHDVYSYYLFG